MFRKLIGTATAVLLLSAGLALAEAPVANAETTNVSATCSTLTVKPNGFAAKGEIRVVVDGDVQTEGTDAGWQSFKGSFSGVYNFDPTTAHSYRVEINSFGDDSAGRTFASGTGYDSTTNGPTVACAPVAIVAATSNCVSSTAAAKQSIDLTFSELRRSTTYLSEVLDSEGTVVKHFQFRTAPVVTKTFTGLNAGERYNVRLTDQSDDTLSSSRAVTIAGCAAKTAVSTSATQCAVPNGSAAITAHLSGLVTGRDYTVSTTPATVSARSFTASGEEKNIRFSGLGAGTTYSIAVSDDSAPRRTTSAPVALADCPVDSTGSTGSSDSSGSAGSTAGDPTSTTGAATSVKGSYATNDIGTPSIENAPSGTAAGSGGQLKTLALGDDSTNGVNAKAVSAMSPYLFGGLAIIMLILAAIAFLAWRRRRA